MGLLHNHKIKKILLALAVLIVLALLAPAADAVSGNGKQAVGRGPKVIVLLLDGLSLGDLENYANLKGLVKSAGLGLVNTRTQSLTTINRASDYLTMGMGVRTQIEEPARGYNVKWAPSARHDEKNSLSEIRNIDAAALNEMVSRDYPNYTLGKIGELAKGFGVKVALVGNSDTDKTENDATLLAMDKSGLIPVGNISRSLLVKDPDFAWGLRTDSGKLLSSALEALRLSDVTFIDFGDTARVSMAQKRHMYDQKNLQILKNRALTNADAFLGGLMKAVDWQKTVLIVVSPTPPVNEPSRINNSLAPIIIYEKNRAPGVLKSNTTRRDGLAANIDIGPTIFARLGFGSKQMNFLGEEITVSPGSDNLGTISHNLAQYTRVKTSRYIVHGVYVTLLVAALISLYLTVFGVRKTIGARTMRALAVMVIAWPAATLLVMAAARVQTYYFNLAAACLITVGLGLVLSKTSDSTLTGMGWLSLITAVFLVLDALSGLRFLLNTPLGFNDVFSGGRYYGINNDCMGILLGSALYAMFYWFHRTGLSRTMRTAIGAVCLFIVVMTQTPGMGANVGGTIAAMTTGVVAIMILASGRQLQGRRVLVTVALVFLVELGIAYLDYRSGGQTHAGKVLGALMSQGFGPKFLEILKSKLGLFGVMLVLPPWNILFGAELYICYLIRRKMHHITDFVKNAYPAQFNSFEAVFYSGIVAFAFNDTGIIATAIIFTYLTMPLAAILSARTDACSVKLNV